MRLSDHAGARYRVLPDFPQHCCEEIFISQVRAGHIKAYATTNKTLLAVAPNIPMVGEAGLPSLSFASWYGLLRRKKEVIGKLNAAVAEALDDPSVRLRVTDIGLEIFPHDQQTPEALAAFQKAEIEKWWLIIKVAGIKAE